MRLEYYSIPRQIHRSHGIVVPVSVIGSVGFVLSLDHVLEVDGLQLCKLINNHKSEWAEAPFQNPQIGTVSIIFDGSQ